MCIKPTSLYDTYVLNPLIWHLCIKHRYLVAIPKLMVPTLEGGTDGDGLFPAFTFEKVCVCMYVCMYVCVLTH
jgi:hypothetical protein